MNTNNRTTKKQTRRRGDETDLSRAHGELSDSSGLADIVDFRLGGCWQDAFGAAMPSFDTKVATHGGDRSIDCMCSRHR